MLVRQIAILILCLVMAGYLNAQVELTDTTEKTSSISINYLAQISGKAERLEGKLDQYSSKLLRQMQKQEARIRKKLEKMDSNKAKEIFGQGQQSYQQLTQKISQKEQKLGQYIPSLDTLASSLKFLQQNPEFLSSAKQATEKVQDALSKINGLETQFQKAENIKQFLKQRRQYLKDQLQHLGFAGELKKINKQAYYYSQQVNEYKALLKDHKKAEKKAIELLSKTKLFQNFMRKNSELASLFRLPGDPNDPITQANLAGLQTRVQVNNLIQQQLAAGGPGAQQQFQQNMQQAQSQLNELKNKAFQYGQGNSEDLMPEGFKPNNQKTKTFLQRLEWGTNIQSQKANGYFPTTSDIGLSLGYKPNDKSIIGIGASYKLGWGKDIRHIDITHQGMGLRSFVDWKIRGSFWISGGYEINYRSELQRIMNSLPLGRGWDRASWQQSGLIGVSKVVSLKTKFFKKTKLQLLWDALSYNQVPRSQPIVFRIGYTF